MHNQCLISEADDDCDVSKTMNQTRLGVKLGIN